MYVTEEQFRELNETLMTQFEAIQDRMKIQIGEVLEKLGCEEDETLMKKLDFFLCSEIKPLRDSFLQVYSKVFTPQMQQFDVRCVSFYYCTNMHSVLSDT